MRLKVLCVLLLAATSCASAQRAGTAAKTAAEVCAKQYAPAVASTAAGYGLRALIAGHVDWDVIETLAKGAGLQVGGCAADAFVRAWRELQPTVVARGADVDPAKAMMVRLGAHWGVEFGE